MRGAGAGAGGGDAAAFAIPFGVATRRGAEFGAVFAFACAASARRWERFCFTFVASSLMSAPCSSAWDNSKLSAFSNWHRSSNSCCTFVGLQRLEMMSWTSSSLISGKQKWMRPWSKLYSYFPPRPRGTSAPNSLNSASRRWQSKLGKAHRAAAIWQGSTIEPICIAILACSFSATADPATGHKGALFTCTCHS